MDSTTENSLPLGLGVRLIARHAAGIIALEKPCGILSHPNTASDQPTALLNTHYDPEAETYLIDNQPPLHLLHRLDSPTSGVILLADNRELAQLIRSRFGTDDVQKIYRALVFGVPRRKYEDWRDQLQISLQKGKLRVRSSPGGKPALCGMQLLRTGRGRPITSLISLHPVTGLTHQLRVQCQKRSLPIVGDTTYGDFAKNRDFERQHGPQRLWLHAESIQLQFPWKNRLITFQAQSPCPAELD